MRSCILLLLIAVPVTAAPVPKGLQKVTPARPDGVYKQLAFSADGAKPAPAENMGADWVVEGEVIYPGTREELARNPAVRPNFTARDPDRPHLRMWAGSVAVYEVDGDTLRVCYAHDGRPELSECKPANGVYYYEFKRVRGEK